MLTTGGERKLRQVRMHQLHLDAGLKGPGARMTAQIFQSNQEAYQVFHTSYLFTS